MDDILKKINTSDLKIIINYYSRNNDSLILTRKVDVQVRVKLIYHHLLHVLQHYLQSKNINENDVSDMSINPSKDELLYNLRQKINNDIKKVLIQFMKIKKAYHKIVDEKYDGDVDGVYDINYLSISEIKVCI